MSLHRLVYFQWSSRLEETALVVVMGAAQSRITLVPLGSFNEGILEWGGGEQCGGGGLAVMQVGTCDWIMNRCRTYVVTRTVCLFILNCASLFQVLSLILDVHC